MKRLYLSVLAASLAWGAVLYAQHQGMAGEGKEHIMMNANELKWGPAPASLPAGAQAAVLEGDPAQQGFFTLRLKVPANYKIPAHWHPADEHVTVIEGTFSMGLGEKFDEKALTDLPVGGFAVMPTGVRHFAMSKEGATIQLHGMGPWGINYVNPKDDPRKKAAK